MSTWFKELKSFIKCTIIDAPNRPVLRWDVKRYLRWVFVRNHLRYGHYSNASDVGLVRLKDLDDYLRELTIYAQDLSFELDYHQSRCVASYKLDLDIPLNRMVSVALPQVEILPFRLTIKNLSQEVLRGVRPVVNGKDWHTLQGIIDYILDSKPRTDREKAYALYCYVKNNRYHGPPPASHREAAMALNPVFFFNYFGYGLCGYAANNYAILCAKVGLPCRVWNVDGHTFPEVYFENGWHVIDPDAEVFYVTPDNPSHWLDMKSIEQSPVQIIAPVHMHPFFASRKETVIGWFANKTSNKIVAYGDALLEKVANQDNIELKFDLYPGEELTYCYNQPGPWYPAQKFLHRFDPPQHRTIIVSDFNGIACCHFNDVKIEGITFEQAFGGQRTLKSTKVDASLTFPLSRPYPLVDGFVKFIGQFSISNIKLYVRKNKQGTFQQVQPVTDHISPWHYRLRRVFYQATPMDGFELKFVFAKEVTLREIRIKLVYQASIFSLPNFKGGKNFIEIASNSSSQPVQLTLCYEQGQPLPEQLNFIPKTPAINSVVDLIELDTFEWQSDTKMVQDEQFRFQFMLGLSPELTYSLVPNFSRIVIGNRLSVTPEDKLFLKKGKKYYWQIRPLNSRNEPLAPWSKFTFTVRRF